MKCKVAKTYKDRIIVDAGQLKGVQKGQTVKVGGIEVAKDIYPNAIFNIVEVNMNSSVAEFVYMYESSPIVVGMDCEIVGEKWGLID